MKTHPQKLKTTPRPLFSCAFFRHCTQTVLSPTTSHPPPYLPLSQFDPPQPPPHTSSPLPPQQPPPPDSESSSFSNTSQSFTQWRFPLPNSPHFSHKPYPPPESDTSKDTIPNPPLKSTHRSHLPLPPPVLAADLQKIFHEAEVHLGSGSDSHRIKALHALEKSLVPNPPAVDGQDAALCPPEVMRRLLGYLKDSSGAKSATKVLLALCLAEGNRRVAVETGAAGRVVEALADLEAAAAERAFAALELLCTVPEEATEVRSHALAVPMLVEVTGKMAGRGKECAISVLAVIYGGSGEEPLAPAEEVERAVAMALQGDCSARGRRKVAQLLRRLQEHGVHHHASV